MERSRSESARRKDDADDPAPAAIRRRLSGKQPVDNATWAAKRRGCHRVSRITRAAKRLGGGRVSRITRAAKRGPDGKGCSKCRYRSHACARCWCCHKRVCPPCRGLGGCNVEIAVCMLGVVQNPLHQRSWAIDHNPQGQRASSIIDHHLTSAQKSLHHRSWTIDHRATTIEGRLCLRIARGVMRWRSTLCFGFRTWPREKLESMHAATFLESHGSIKT